MICNFNQINIRVRPFDRHSDRHSWTATRPTACTAHTVQIRCVLCMMSRPLIRPQYASAGDMRIPQQVQAAAGRHECAEAVGGDDVRRSGPRPLPHNQHVGLACGVSQAAQAERLPVIRRHAENRCAPSSLRCDDALAHRPLL